MNAAADITLLDGAMGAALRERGVKVPDYKTSIWSALALIEAPEAVRALHRDYIRAGADVITANNYAVTPILLAREGLEARLAELTQTASRLAAEARDAENPAAKVAGSLPPLNTSYRADLVGGHDEILPVYRHIAELLAPDVDILLCETMTTADEAHAAAQAAADCGKSIWVSWTLDEKTGCLRGGETVAQALAQLDGLPVEAFLFNCCSAAAVQSGLSELAARGARPFGAYANPFGHEPPEDEQTSRHPDWLDAEAYAQAAGAWRARGAAIVGGCCGTNPDYIRRLGETLRDD